MLRPIRFQCAGVWISAGLPCMYVHIQLAILVCILSYGLCRTFRNYIYNVFQTTLQRIPPYNITVFKDLTPCDLVAGYERLTDTDCLRYTVEAVKMGAANLHETLVLVCQATRRHAPQDRIHGRGHIKSHFCLGADGTSGPQIAHIQSQFLQRDRYILQLTARSRVLRVELTVSQPLREIPRILWNPNVHHLVYNSPPLDPLSFLDDSFYSNHPTCVCVFQVASFFRFPHKTRACISLLLHTCQINSFSYPSFDFHDNIF